MNSTRTRLFLFLASLAAIALVAALLFLRPDEPAVPVADGAAPTSADAGAEGRGDAEAGRRAAGAPAAAAAVAGTPVPLRAGVRPDAGGGAAVGGVAAVVRRASGETVSPRLNGLGHFERIHVAAGESLPVRVVYPEGQPEDPVAIEVQDGGALDSGAIAQLGRLDAERALAFTYSLSANPGIHRVMLRKGADTRTFDFWVGPDIPLAAE